MSTFKPDGWPTVTPRLFTPDVAGLVAFLKDVFDAEGEPRAGGPAEVRIGDSVVMVSDGGGVREVSAATLYVYVMDADAVYRRALASGARSVEAPTDTPYGDRRAMVQDSWGNSWQIATYRGA
jgi:uncharacterized glyoxalase superfamily protein PhnB